MRSAKEACEQLVQDALDAGGTDNVTVIVGRTMPAEEVPAAAGHHTVERTQARHA
jgi:serine/threonine protein phosphatase PrpC